MGRAGSCTLHRICGLQRAARDDLRVSFEGPQGVTGEMSEVDPMTRIWHRRGPVEMVRW